MDSLGPAYQNVPVRGRPLIFAAMTTEPSEVGEVEEAPVLDAGEVGVYEALYNAAHTATQDIYPSPASSGRRSPQKMESASEAELDAIRKPRKLSKSRKQVPPAQVTTRQHTVEATPVGVTDGQHYPQSPPQPATPPHHHHHHHHEQSSQDVELRPIEPLLSSPFQYQQAQPTQPSPHANGGDQSPRKRPTPLEHNKSSSRHGVKTLTDKQLQKLNRRSTPNIEHTIAREREREVPTIPQQEYPPPPIPPPKPLLTPPTPPSPEEYANARAQRRGHVLDKSRAPLPAPPVEERVPSIHESEPQSIESEEPPEPQYYPLTRHIADSVLLGNLLCYLAYFEWCQLSAVSREIRQVVSENRELEELVLERYLRTVGYDRWIWKQPEPLKLNLADLCNYMRGVSIPSHQYARTAEAYLQSNSSVNPITTHEMAASCRAFTRVVLRLRVQAEAEAEHIARITAALPQPSPPLQKPAKWARGPPSRSSSRAPSPSSSFSHPHTSGPRAPVSTFRSPLFRPRRAPLLQVFVPSPEGDWLSDASVLECEAELKRSGVTHCLRAGDIVWDVAVGDEGNVGRLVWDGSYLIDLDYTYSRVGDLPRYLPTMAFPPSYFHRVIRTMGTGNPVVHVDLSPWEDQIAFNLQLLQDRMKTETRPGEIWLRTVREKELFKILPTTQTYDWGKTGSTSKVAQFAAASKIPGFTLKSDVPYAELWMGTHPSSPSHVLSDVNITLASCLAAQPELVGEKVASRFKDAGAAEGNLPFLFKILAIRKALSIQTHPDKATAEKLHKEQPNVYKDANHKPEMAIALTPFTALCGFLPLERIATYLAAAPEFAALIPQIISEKFIVASQSLNPSGPSEKSALKDLFSALMTAEVGLFTDQLDKLVQRYTNDGETEAERDVKELVLTLYTQFPGDIGVFCAFVLNYIKMDAGEAIFLSAGEPHAYISGDIVETMATSDNVIRAGLTPKLRDVPNLVAGLTYNAAEPSKHLIQPVAFRGTQHTSLYDPPIPEFSVLRVELADGQMETHPPIDGPSVAIVTSGWGEVRWGSTGVLHVRQGEVFFIGAGSELQFAPRPDADGKVDTLNIYRAFVDVHA
ncbi:hypothetical protein EUX98_g4294 [Antrodiella citrinella]|uniref:Mannose-6-phosphate isomerase n=1 Tax=Antrodiella citrinella TaxID=2447956 RepID=A0A4S4N2D4_9APHY|nr:hypothetical protein EUX98_g4294 [Antrodiella citrinella]